MRESKHKVLLGSPVRQKPEILKAFLVAIERLCQDGLVLDYYFIDDNIEEESSRLLGGFAKKTPNTTVLATKAQDKSPYVCNESTHVWEEELIWKVACFKNQIIEKAINDDYDYLFLVDSDLVLQPKTLEHLVDLHRDIISEIFWTRWEPNYPELPQVWIFDQYNLYQNTRGQVLTQEEILQRVKAFVQELRIPGVYQVGGLGACTLISKTALQSGVNFNEIYNLSFVGEDRHFCIRAAALGFKLYVDTHYPAQHIYRLSDLDK